MNSILSSASIKGMPLAAIEVRSCIMYTRTQLDRYPFHLAKMRKSFCRQSQRSSHLCWPWRWMMLWHMTRLLSTWTLCMSRMKSILNLLYSLFNSSIGHKVRRAKWIDQAKVLARSLCMYIFCYMIYRREPTLLFPHAASSGLWISTKLYERASPLSLNIPCTSLVQVRWDVCHHRWV
jgi:hypothetical protein